MTHDAIPTDRLYTINEAAEYLRISRDTLYRLIKRGDLPATSVGQRIRLRGKDIEAYLDLHR